MALNEQEELLTEFEAWAAERRVTKADISPAAFLIDRAKATALERITKAVDLIDALEMIYSNPEEHGEVDAVGYEADIQGIKNILNGTEDDV